jgi:hypothetical protein
MPNDDDRPLSEEELARAREGQALIAAAVTDVRAPQSLREAIERERERSRRRAAPFWRRRRWALVGVCGVAIAVAAVAIALDTGGGTADPSLNQVVATAGLAPTEAAPAKAGGDPPVLAANVGELEFPNWETSFAWEAVGRRDDTLAGRRVTTIIYRNPEGARLGYAVVSGETLEADPPGRQVTRSGKTYHVAGAGGRTIVTWNQQGHTCVIVASAVVPADRLVNLAASRNV